MKSEAIYASISNTVVERAEYLCKNSENSSLNLTISLPFDGFTLPTNISLSINGVAETYNWSTLNYTTPSGYNIIRPTIIFNITFGPYEEKTIIANYSRFFIIDVDLFSYGYLTDTSHFWNHCIEYASFNFIIDISIGMISVFGLDGYSSSLHGRQLHISKEFYNWTPETNIAINFDTRIPPIPGFSLFSVLAFAQLPILILYSKLKRRN